MCKKMLIFSLTFCLGIAFSQILNRAEVMDVQPMNENVSSNYNLGNFPVTADSQKKRFLNTGMNDKEIVDFFTKFQNAVAVDDKITVASMLHYPVCVRFASGDLNRKGCREINNKTFLKNYDKIFDDDFKKFITNIDVEKKGQLGVLWGNWRGVTVDRGQIWFQGICKDKQCKKYELRFTTLSSGFLERPYDESSHKETPGNDAN